MAGLQYLLLSFAEGLKPGGNSRVVAGSNSEEEARARLDALDSSVTGRVALVEVKQVFERKPAIQNIPVDSPVVETET